MAEATEKKAGRISRLWPSRASSLPPRMPPMVRDEYPEPCPPRGLTARELIEMARAARRSSKGSELR